MRSLVNRAISLIAFSLAGVASQGYALPAASSEPTPLGPEADFPVTVGAPYTIGETTWRPLDQLNYDAVGYTGVAEGLSGISASHKTLPYPSYAEVTSLETGRTILVRVSARGPLDNDTLVGLSEDASTQLGLTPGKKSAVRVRRVNPPEVERAALRMGGFAPMRMETPESLLGVLRRKLASQSPSQPPASTPPPMPPVSQMASVAPSVPSGLTPQTSRLETPALVSEAPVVTDPITPNSAQSRVPVAENDGNHVIQVAAFSTKERADAAARTIGGKVTPAGRYYHLRLGPFKGGKEAASALEKAKRAGYSDARIQRVH